MSEEQVIQTEVATPEEGDAPEIVENEAPIENADSGDETGSSKEEVWPKKAQNAVSRYKKEMNRARAEMRALQAQVQQFQAMMNQTQKPVDDGPKEADFETVIEYLEARAEHKAKKAAEEYYKKQSTQTNEHATQVQFMEQRGAYIEQKENELVKSIPDLKEVIEDSDELYYLPQNIKEMFIMSDNPSLAAYNLIKEGKISALANMHPQLAAAEIVRAQSLMPQRRISSAPQPMKGLSGGGNSGSKAVEQMSGSELLKWVNS
ncbi:MAG: hypothetical protein E6R03_01335 [Hyphomicrobiaceae bacterium]|nr:MAG: hypothetical protein E6R03_01335 [Hyphomicrobiaceae bacterium]